MKKTLQILKGLALAATLNSSAQTQRISLFEEWTGENCPPCASVNPGITTLTLANQNSPKKMILLRYQVAIPSAPTSPTSLYQQNTTEPTSRQSYYYPTGSDRFAPQGRFNGRELGTAPNNGNAGYLDQATINGDYQVDAPFALTTGYVWNAAYDSITITTTITAAQAFTTANPLKLQLAIIEEHIQYATAPGTNGEKDFEFVMRKMVPNQTGQTLAGTWTNGQTQTIVNKVKLPTYIWNKGEVAIVGFIQETNPSAGPTTVMNIHQAAYGDPAPLALDANVETIAGISASACTPDFTPSITIMNSGVSALTACTINYKIDNGTVMTQPWTGNLTTGQSQVVALPMQTTTAGTHTFTAYTSDPNASSDNNAMNDSKNTTFIVFGATQVAPITQAFATTGIPAGYNVGNPDGGYTWTRVTSVGGCLKYDGYNNGNDGDIDYFYVPRINTTGLSGMELRFDVAHRIYNTTYVERLEVIASTDCGATWATLYNKVGATLATMTASTAVFTPTVVAPGATNWRSETVNMNAYDNQSDVLVAFKLTNGYGNNVYLDNINIVSNPVGIRENNSFTSVSIYPNPASSEAFVKISSNVSDPATVKVYNTLGQLLMTVNTDLVQGENELKLNTAELSSGVYNIEISSKIGKIVQKLSVAN